MRGDQKTYVLMIFAAFFWSGAFIAGKYCIPYIPTFTMTFIRFAAATVILYFMKGYSSRKAEEEDRFCLEKKHVPIFLFTGVVGMFGYHVLFFTSIKYTTAINASIIGAANPIVTTLIAGVFLRQKIPGKQIVGIVISFVGVLLTISGASLNVLRHFAFDKGDLWMGLAVICWSAYAVYSKSRGKGIPPLILTYYSFLVCTILLIPFTVWEKPWEFITQVPLLAWAGVLYMSVFSSVLGYLIQQMAIKRIGPSRSSIFVNLVPVFSIVLAVLILNEQLQMIKLFTAGIIIAGVCICQLAGSKKEALTDDGI